MSKEGRLSSTRTKRVSMIPTLSLNKTETSHDPKKFAHLSFSEEFHDKVKEEKIKIEIHLYSGQQIEYETSTGETISNLIKYCEAKFDLPKDETVMIYKENFLLPCLSLADVPDLLADKTPVITAMKDPHCNN